jgi:cytochrome P450
MIERERRAPGPKGFDLLRSFLTIRRDRLAFSLDIQRRFGDVVAIRMGRQRLFIVSHPDYARYVLIENAQNYDKGLGLDDVRPLLGGGLLTGEGETWRIHRSALRPIFDTQQLETFQSAMASVIASELDQWQPQTMSCKSVDLEAAVSQMVMAILDKTIVGGDLRDMSEDLTRDLSFLSRWAMLHVVAIARLPLVIPTPTNLAVRRAIRRLEGNVSAIRRAWREGGSSSSTFGRVLSDVNAFSNQATDVRDEILTFLLAGHETTVTTLTWALHLLARHPSVFAQIQSEIEDTFDGDHPSFVDLQNLRFLRMTVDEVLRLYPPVWMVTRKAKTDDRVGQYVIPAGSQVLLSIYGIHRHRTFWSDPERFLPERFADSQYEKQARHAYFPFGLGARSCLGNRFALVEIMTALAMIAKRFNLRTESYESVGADAFLTLRPSEQILIGFEERILKNAPLPASARPINTALADR